MNVYRNYIAPINENAPYDELKEKFKINIPDNFNFAYDVVDWYAENAPDKRALVWCNDEGEEHIYTFKQISEESKKTAGFLVSQGIKKGDKVLLLLRRRFEFWYFMLALHRIGAIAVPGTVQLTAKDIEYRIKMAKIKMIVAIDEPDLMKEIEDGNPSDSTVEKFVKVKSHSILSLNTLTSFSKNIFRKNSWIDFNSEFNKKDNGFENFNASRCTNNDDTMLLYFTSGTSGEPKMVAHNFVYPLGHIVTAKFWQNVIDDGLHLTIAETGWAKAVWGKLYGQWLCGSAVFAYDMLAFKPKNVIEKILHYGVTTFCAPPTVYRYLVRTDLSKYDLSNVKYWVTAGEAVSPEIIQLFHEQTGKEFHEAYGQTEATVIIGNFPGMNEKQGSMGKPAPGYDVRIVDENGKDCNCGEKGEIIINLEKGKPFGLFAGYYNDEERTKKVFANGIYHTGDTAYIDDDGYFFFVGRNDDMIKSAGFRISPFEVESVLQLHPSVLECAVTGVADPKRGMVVKASIVLNKGFSESHELAQELQDFVLHRIALYKKPRIIEFVKELPKTISGKIIHRQEE